MSDTSNLPSPTVLQHAAKLSILNDKPIMLDYWDNSFQTENQVIIGVKTENDETKKVLVKSSVEYTSNIEKCYKVENVFILMTENSIYLVSAGIKTKKLS